VDIPVFEKKHEVSAKKILFMARLHEKKGLVELIRAWEMLNSLHHELAEKWTLVIAGSGEDLFEKKLRRLMENLSAGRSSISFRGLLSGEEKNMELCEASAFVLPSFSEGMPNGVLEAWSYGLPVVMTSECNLPEGEKAGAAVIVRPEKQSIMEGLKTIIEAGADKRLEMGRKGRSLVKAEFSWSVVAGKMASVYDWLTGLSGHQPDCVVKL